MMYISLCNSGSSLDSIQTSAGTLQGTFIQVLIPWWSYPKDWKSCRWYGNVLHIAEMHYGCRLFLTFALCIFINCNTLITFFPLLHSRPTWMWHRVDYEVTAEDGTSQDGLSIGASFFHFFPRLYTIFPLFAFVIIPNLLWEAIGLNLE